MFVVVCDALSAVSLRGVALCFATFRELHQHDQSTPNTAGELGRGAFAAVHVRATKQLERKEWSHPLEATPKTTSLVQKMVSAPARPRPLRVSRDHACPLIAAADLCCRIRGTRGTPRYLLPGLAHKECAPTHSTTRVGPTLSHPLLPRTLGRDAVLQGIGLRGNKSEHSIAARAQEKAGQLALNTKLAVARFNGTPLPAEPAPAPEPTKPVSTSAFVRWQLFQV